MEKNNDGHIKADNFYKSEIVKNKTNLKYEAGTAVSLKLTGEKLLILSELVPEDDEYGLGVKYLTRTVDHKKKVVFACELVLLSENETSLGRV